MFFFIPFLSKGINKDIFTECLSVHQGPLLLMFHSCPIGKLTKNILKHACVFVPNLQFFAIFKGFKVCTSQVAEEVLQ